MWDTHLKHMLSNKEALELYHDNFMFSLSLKLKGQWPKNQKKDLSTPLFRNSRNTHDLMFEHLASQTQRAIHALNERNKNYSWISPSLLKCLILTYYLY